MRLEFSCTPGYVEINIDGLQQLIIAYVVLMGQTLAGKCLTHNSRVVYGSYDTQCWAIFVDSGVWLDMRGKFGNRRPGFGETQQPCPPTRWTNRVGLRSSTLHLQLETT